MYLIIIHIYIYILLHTQHSLCNRCHSSHYTSTGYVIGATHTLVRWLCNRCATPQTHHPIFPHKTGSLTHPHQNIFHS